MTDCRAGEAAIGLPFKKPRGKIQVRDLYISFIQTGYNNVLKRGWYLPCHCHDPPGRRLPGSFCL
jgi:hypothetical protein